MITLKTYEYKNGFKVWYMQIGGHQFGLPYFSEKEAREAIELLTKK